MSSVVIVGPAHPLRGGLASFDERLAREFQTLGWTSSISTFSLQYPEFLFPGTSQYSTEEAPKDLKIDICINSINPFNWLIIGNRLRRMKPDIIVVRYWLPFMGPCLGTILRLVKLNGHTQIICIADNIIPHEKRIGDKLFTSYFLPVPHGFVTMSDKVMKELKSLRPKALCKLVQHPLYDNFGDKVSKEIARNKLGIDPKVKLCLFFGFIRKYKGLDLLLEAFQEEDVMNSDIRLLVAGEFYEDEKPYLEILSKNNLASKVYWHTHFISDSDVKYYLSAADVIIQPYRNATQSGVTPLAYHFEIPMIVSNVGGLPGLVKDHQVGLVCEPNKEMLGRSIVEFFKLDQECFQQNIKTGKKKLSWSSLVDSILSLRHDLEK